MQLGADRAGCQLAGMACRPARCKSPISTHWRKPGSMPRASVSRWSKMQWFGKSWGASICESIEHVPTPVGELCGWCEEVIEEQDGGLIIPHVTLNRVTPTPRHLECFIRQTAGSVARQLKAC